MKTNLSESEVVKILKTKTPKEFDQIKLIFEEKQKPSRYVCIEYKALEVIPEINSVTSPVSSEFKEKLESHSNSNDELTTELIDFKKRLKKYKNYTSKRKNFQKELSRVEGLEEEMSILDKNQRGFIQIINSTIEILECKKCLGKKYIACMNNLCKGNGHYTCPSCHGKKESECKECQGKGVFYCKECKNTKSVPCKKCSGTGSTISAGVKEACQTCQRTGTVNCKTCEGKSGVCPHCEGKIIIGCDECKATGVVKCDMCFADGPYKSLMPCDKCEGEGHIARYDCVEYETKEKKITNVYCLDKEFWEIDANDIENASKSVKPKVIKIKNKEDIVAIKEIPDVITEKIVKIREQFRIKDHSGRVSEEILEYRMLPCVSIPYLHIITGIRNEVFVLGEGENITVKYSRNPTKVKIGLSNDNEKRGKMLGLVGNLFAKKKNINKIDNRSELILFIYLMKADGVIDEKEKEFLVDRIHTTTTFDIDDKRLFFQLLNSQELPKLSSKYVKFSTREKATDVIYNLKKLALSDGDIAPSENELIQELERIYTVK